MQNNLSYWLAAHRLPRIGPRTLLQVVEKLGEIALLFQIKEIELRALGVPEKVLVAIRQVNWQQVESDLIWGTLPGHTILHFQHPDYPAQLKEIHQPPLVLYIKGNATALSLPQLAIVGSRHASRAGLENAYQFSKQLAVHGLVITSGLALGVDGAAHKGALAAQAATIAVMGAGLNHLYPASHRALAEDILLHHGALISEFPIDAPPHPAHFPRRNRIISGLSAGVLVVEAALKSGSLITARYALEQGRDVFAIPGSIHQAMARGCHYLIKQGAKLVEQADDVLSELSVLVRAINQLNSGQSVDSYGNLSETEKRILMQVEYEMTPLDVVVLRSELTLVEVSSILLTLELQGYIDSVPGGYVRSSNY